MVKLYHRKSPNGCVRCKRRKVKCDEDRPACGACRKHGLDCQYPQSLANAHPTNPNPSPSPKAQQHATGLANISNASVVHNDAEAIALEQRLLHYYLTQTVTLLNDQGLWKHRAMLMALEHRFLLDGIMALAAIDLYRQTEDVSEHNPVPPKVTVGSATLSHPASQTFRIDHREYLGGYLSSEMRQISSKYFHAAVEGQQQALKHLGAENFEAVFLASILIMNIALFHLGCSEVFDDDSPVSPLTEALWIRLGVGCRSIVTSWQNHAQTDVLRDAGYFEKRPDMSDKASVFDPSNRRPFETLLVWATDFEKITTEEREVYEKALSYIGLIWRGIKDDNVSAPLSSSFIIAFPAYIPEPFNRLVLEERPRALAVMAHMFAMMRLLEVHIPWYRGIATRQIPSLCKRLPPAWKQTMTWPLAILNRDISSSDSLPVPPSIDDLTEIKV